MDETSKKVKLIEGNTIKKFSYYFATIIYEFSTYNKKGYVVSFTIIYKKFHRYCKKQCDTANYGKKFHEHFKFKYKNDKLLSFTNL
jgi:hypothetical protein